MSDLTAALWFGFWFGVGAFGFRVVRAAWTAFRLRDREPRLILLDEWDDASGQHWARVEVRPRLFGRRP